MNRRYLLIGVGAAVALIAVWSILSGKRTHSSDTAAVSSSQSATAAELYAQAKKLQSDRDLFKAKEIYQQIMQDFPSYQNIEAVQKQREAINMEIILSNTPSPNAVTHEVAVSDTLGVLAKKYNTTIELIKQNNNLKSDTIRVGQKLRVWTGQFNIFVDKSQNKLMLKVGDEVMKIYDVSTGQNNSTPVGDFTITTKLIDPVWFNRGVVVPPESPENVLGSRWLGFDLPGYGIHGTVEPETIGQQVTAGCVRMRNQDVEELYGIIPMGTKVAIVD